MVEVSNKIKRENDQLIAKTMLKDEILREEAKMNEEKENKGPASQKERPVKHKVDYRVRAEELE